MKIIEIRVRNYKSLRDVTWAPEQVSVVVGANNSGKSNLADFFDFLSDVYTDGLPKAVVRKGGYENIAHRKSRRAKGGITVEVHAEAEPKRPPTLRRAAMRSSYKTRLFHRFSFRAEGESIMAEFRVTEETFKIEREVEGEWKNLFSLTRDGERLSGKRIENEDQLGHADAILIHYFDSLFKDDKSRFRSIPQNTELLFQRMETILPHILPDMHTLAHIQVLQINTATARESGVPASDQVLGRHSEQLPTVIDWLQQKYPPIWSRIFGMMQNLMPGLESIDVDYTDFKTRGLFFREKGIGRPWRTDEISDGTIHCLAFFVGLFDPRPSMVVIEEPENSVHPWILHQMMEEVREEAKTKQIVITTHSPFVVDAVRPEDVWVIWRKNAESKIKRFLDIDDTTKKSVLKGGLTVSDYLNMGAVREAVPPAPSVAAAE